MPYKQKLDISQKVSRKFDGEILTVISFNYKTNNYIMFGVSGYVLLTDQEVWKLPNKRLDAIYLKHYNNLILKSQKQNEQRK